MKRNFSVLALFVIAIAAAGLFYYSKTSFPESHLIEEEEEEQDEKTRAVFTRLRWQHEFDMIKDPVLNRVPENMVRNEILEAQSIPLKQNEIRSFIPGSPGGVDDNNTYQAVGPNNIGGRTRVVAFDKRTNQVIIAGCISGGIYRSADGGNNWTRVTPDANLHNFSSLAQDPRAGFEDTWYAGGGEPIANSAAAPGAFYLSESVWKSTNNGLTWAKTTETITGLANGTREGFDHPFDIIHRIAVNPTNGHVYVAGHRRFIRSTDGGNSWEIAFNTSLAAGSATGQMDVAVNSAGRVFLAVNGAMPDVASRGVWVSNTGIAPWTRIAGGSILNVDSVSNWRGNDPTGGGKRILLTVAPSNQNLLYVLYENGLSQSGATPSPEVDMYRLDVSGGSTVWTNLSANMPDFPTGNREGVDPIAIQGGYDMMVHVKPDDANVVFVGGTCLYRSTNGFTSTGATSWIGGYGNTLPTLTIYPNSHPDIHFLAFDPTNPSRALCGNDGGLQVTANILANTTPTEPVTWSMVRNYQTMQYYHVGMDPISGRNNFLGGSQDNGTHVRLDGNNDHIRIVGGDGGAVGMHKPNGATQISFGSYQLGNIFRGTLTGGTLTNYTEITPTGLTRNPDYSTGFGDFVTYFKVDFDNPDHLYYVNYNRLFRTTASATVTSGGWTELTGVSSSVNPGNPTAGTNVSISALELTRGDYFPSHALYIGTSSGRLFRLDNPANTSPSTSASDITPTSLPAGSYISDIAANPNNDEEVLMVVSNYSVNNNVAINIWWTNNAKSSSPTWRLAEGNLQLPSIRSAMIVVKKDASNNPVTEYYLGTSVGLYSAINIGPTLTANNQPTWTREGATVLNFAVVPSLDYRPQDNILLVGTHGNGLYFASTGTTNFTPNLNTGINDPVRNDKKFIQLAYPTITKSRIYFTIGNMFTIPRIVIQVYSSNGQLMLRREDLYQSGNLDVSKLAAGSYILTITSRDYKQQFVQSFVKD